ncbi:MAG: PspA/IM30 family protein [Clostridia bacterium]|nr:PspA/IM30 family protein [Clostridia bacterium]
MGIFSRMKDIMSSNINALLDKAENPQKMIDQMLRQSREDLAEVKKETGAVMANETAALNKVKECEETIAKFTKAAENAVKAGNDADALQLIQSKNRQLEQLNGLKENYEAAHADAENMRAMYRKLSNDIASLEGRADMIKGKAATAKAREHANKVTAGVGNTSSLEAFDRMEAKVNKQLDTANAIASLDKEGAADTDLLSKYASGPSGGSAQDELEAMKAKLGM